MPQREQNRRRKRESSRTRGRNTSTAKHAIGTLRCVYFLSLNCKFCFLACWIWCYPLHVGSFSLILKLLVCKSMKNNSHIWIWGATFWYRAPNCDWGCKRFDMGHPNIDWSALFFHLILILSTAYGGSNLFCFRFGLLRLMERRRSSLAICNFCFPVCWIWYHSLYILGQTFFSSNLFSRSIAKNTQISI